MADEKKRNIAVITARGGSKRIPKKNIKEFCGKPIISYSIEAAINSGIFDEVMVSTDSDEIAEIARKYGAKVPFMRSDATSNDFATTEDVLIEVLDCYKELGEIFSTICCIYPTAPFVTAKKLKDALGLYENNINADSIVPIVKFGFPPQRAFVIRDGVVCYQYPEYMTARSQDLEPIYQDAGQFYICDIKSLYKYHNLVAPNAMPFVVPEEEVQDIDNQSDWIIAELKYKAMRGVE